MASSIKLGPDLSLDLDLLMGSRLLIQGGSGSGKSWFLRRLAEQLFGKVPVIIIDPEGEFASLREKFGYVLVGPGGETPADIRSAGMVAHKLLELRASAVCDIYELPPAKRHEWVRDFLMAMIDAPKNLWRPVVVIVDEAHMFAPEADKSVASDAMISLASRGRKRGFCLVAATQRLGKFSKDVAAELQNVIIGLTSIDIDRERAVEALGVSKSEKAAVSHQLKTLNAGEFWAFGRALTLERKLFHAGEIQTTHPKAGSSKHAAAPPPTPEKIKGLLPKLADLPQHAEAKALTEKELRRQLAEATAELKQKNTTLAQIDTQTQRIQSKLVAKTDSTALADAKRAITELKTQLAQHRRALEQAMKIIVKVKAIDFNVDSEQDRKDLETAVAAAVRQVTGQIEKRVNGLVDRVEGYKRAAGETEKAIAALLEEKIDLTVQVERREPFAVTAPRAGNNGRSPARAQVEHKPLNGDEPLSPVMSKIVSALAELRTLGAEEPARELVALLSDYTNLTSKGFVNAMSALSTAGWVYYPGSGTVGLTEEGWARAEKPEAPRSPADVQRRICELLGGKSAEILQPLIKAYPEPMPRADVAAAAGYTNLTSKGFVNAMSRLRTLGFVDYPDTGSAVAMPVLFLEGR